MCHYYYFWCLCNYGCFFVSIGYKSVLCFSYIFLWSKFEVMCFNVFPFVKYFRSIYYYEILPDKYFQDRNTILVTVFLEFQRCVINTKGVLKNFLISLPITYVLECSDIFQKKLENFDISYIVTHIFNFQ